MSRRPFLVLLAFSALLRAQVVHVRDYRTHEPRDRWVLFKMAVTPDQDVLSLVPKADGKWRLTRIRGWLDKNPIEQTIEVPGWPAEKGSGPGSESLADLHSELLVTPDSHYLVCVATGYWARDGQRGGRSDDMVSVIDLRTFTIAKTIRTSEVGQGLWEFYLHPSGRLALQAAMSLPVDDQGRPHTEPLGVDPRGWPIPGSPLLHEPYQLAILSLPDLTLMGQCRYTESRQGFDWDAQDIVSGNPGGCGALLASMAISGSLRGFIASLGDGAHLPTRPSRQPCSDAGSTKDGRLRLESCDQHHLTIWNRDYVTDRLWLNIVSASTGMEVGKIQETTRDSVESEVAEQNGRDYVLVMEGGTNLKVYELK